MGYSVESTTEVQDSNVCLSLGVPCFEKVTECDHQLCFTGVTLSESVLQVGQHVVCFKEVQDMRTNDVF